MVRNGIDSLRSNHFESLRGRRVGLVTNHTGLAMDGRSTIDLLHEAGSVTLVTLFGPEHGIRGELDSKIVDGVDARTGLPIWSLYGERFAPEPAHLAGINTLVFDIQDVGARFYTYLSTLKNCMQAAAGTGIRFVVLDRPNPLGGERVEGPVADQEALSFVAVHPVPIRHGLTLGELALMLVSDLGLNLDLHVVKVEGWRRSDTWDTTGLTWINPSPNMRSLTQAFLYPGICLIEYTNLSVGRGTDTPFEQFGAPWIDARLLSAELNQNAPSGVRFVPVRFTPTSGPFVGQLCHGVNTIIIDRQRFTPVAVGIHIIVNLHHTHPQWQIEPIDKLLVHKASMDRIRSGATAHEVTQSWLHDLESFEARRRPFLLY